MIDSSKNSAISSVFIESELWANMNSCNSKKKCNNCFYNVFTWNWNNHAYKKISPTPSTSVSDDRKASRRVRNVSLMYDWNRPKVTIISNIFKSGLGGVGRGMVVDSK